MYLKQHQYKKNTEIHNVHRVVPILLVWPATNVDPFPLSHSIWSSWPDYSIYYILYLYVHRVVATLLSSQEGGSPPSSTSEAHLRRKIDFYERGGEERGVKGGGEGRRRRACDFNKCVGCMHSHWLKYTFFQTIIV